MHRNSTSERDADTLGLMPLLDRELLTAEQVAMRLGVKPSWVHKAARDNRIPHLRLGRYRRFNWSDIQRWLDGQRSEP